MTGPLPSSRFRNLMELTPDQIMKMREVVMPVACPGCGGRGHQVQEAHPETVTIFGITMEGMMVSIRPCFNCGGTGAVPGLSAN